MLSIPYLLRESKQRWRQGCERMGTHRRPSPTQAIQRIGKTGMRLTGNGKALAVLLVVFLFCDFLLSPLVFETRASAIIGNPASLLWLEVLFGGLILNIIALILVSFRPRTASILSIVGSIAYIAVSLADQVGYVSTIAAPPPVSDVEIAATVVLIGALFFASRVYKESTKSAASASTPSRFLLRVPSGGAEALDARPGGAPYRLSRTRHQPLIPKCVIATPI